MKISREEYKNMDIMKVIDFLYMDDDQIKDLPEPEKPHGKLIEYKQDSYNDIFIFEDGYTERYYIGD